MKRMPKQHATLQASLAPAKLCERFSGTGRKLVSKAWSSKPSEVAPAGAVRGASTSLDVVRLPTDGVGEGGTPDAALDGKPAGQVTAERGAIGIWPGLQSSCHFETQLKIEYTACQTMTAEAEMSFLSRGLAGCCKVMIRTCGQARRRCGGQIISGI